MDMSIWNDYFWIKNIPGITSKIRDFPTGLLDKESAWNSVPASAFKRNGSFCLTIEAHSNLISCWAAVYDSAKIFYDDLYFLICELFKQRSCRYIKNSFFKCINRGDCYFFTVSISATFVRMIKCIIFRKIERWILNNAVFDIRNHRQIGRNSSLIHEGTVEWVDDPEFFMLAVVMVRIIAFFTHDFIFWKFYF